ncbi:diaminopimelate decarboxylase [Agrococcus sp. SGAir0287]|uniref:diaminopimelate decarboxylase n=1 Tax=Agrococcus sp. SGAir0287 TaxID=2070347 RepID=UPI0010CD5D4F|nr:diaminopimelate decarboxylase [Agrococcus sp. SGAir0287]QCR19713.1 diaminopimelate decarboxylase [Agrococcus sp. SGAir0287]
MTHAIDADALQPAIWPTSAQRVDGVVHVAGARLDALVADHGTPLMLLDEAELRGRARRIRDAFSAVLDDPLVYYAGKALLTADVARWVTAEGLCVDVCSAGELALVRAAGVDLARVGYHGNAKSEAELRVAVAAGVGTIVVDSEIELERLTRIAREAGVRQGVRLRINVGVHASTHEFLATSHEDQKFGVPIADATALVERIRADDVLRLRGLHTHIGSQIFDGAGFAAAFDRMVALHASLLPGGDLPELNLGGGFGIAYTEADDPQPIERIAQDFADALRAACEREGIPMPRIAIEPGRSIAGPAGITVYTVGTVKRVELADGERVYVSVDGGMSDNPRHVLYGAQYTARVASRTSDAEPVRARVVGLHCESGDIVVEEVRLPADVAPGDLLAVPATGAYCASLASNYNMTPRPPIVAVADGASRVLVRRETIDDLLARDAGLGGTTA